MDRSWDMMMSLAIARGLTTLARNMRLGVFDETCLLDRQMIKRLLTNRG